MAQFKDSEQLDYDARADGGTSGGSTSGYDPKTMGPDEAAWNATHFYTDSPGPLYDNYGRRKADTPQPTSQQVYDMVQNGQYFNQAGPPTADSQRQLLNAYTAYGYDAKPYMYGDTPSGNELSINGQKTKFTSGGNFGDPGAQWYKWGSNDAGPTSGNVAPSPNGGLMAGMQGWQPGSYKQSSIFAGAPGGADSGAFFQFLLGRANGTIKDSSIPNLQVGPDDPLIRRQTAAYGAEQTRGGRRYLQQLAERSGPNANIGTESRMVAEKGAQATAGFEGQLIQQELNSRRAQLQQSLSTGAQFMSEQQRMQLQEELAQIDNARSMYQFQSSQGQQESQFERDLSQRAFEFGSNDQFRNSPNGGG